MDHKDWHLHRWMIHCNKDTMNSWWLIATLKLLAEPSGFLFGSPLSPSFHLNDIVLRPLVPTLYKISRFWPRTKWESFDFYVIHRLSYRVFCTKPPLERKTLAPAVIFTNQFLSLQTLPKRFHTTVSETWRLNIIPNMTWSHSGRCTLTDSDCESVHIHCRL